MTTLKLNGDTPNVIIFAIQASGDPLTGGQINASREAAKSVLEALGCDVSAVSDVISIEHEDGDVLNITAEIQ